jgi:CBS domain containing-hemolysin-like protein
VDSSAIAIWVYAFSLLVLAIAAAAQASLFYIDRVRLRHLLENGVPRARALTEMLDAPGGTFSSIHLTVSLTHFLAAGAVFWVALSWLPVSPWAVAAVAVGGFLVMVIAQFAGRLVAVSRPEGTALALVRPVEVLTVLLGWPLAGVVWLERAVGVKRTMTPAEAEERLRHLVEDNAELEEDERDMIASVIELGDQPVRELMVPRIDIVALPSTARVRDVLDCVVASGHSRIPIFDATVDNVVGMVYAKDVLKYLRDGSQDAPAAPLAREPYFVPETKKVDELLHEMQAMRVHLAVVVDEYGGTAGLISIEDLIEEIVGEIQDEYDVEEQPIESVSDTEAIFDARVSIRDVNDTLDLDLDDEDFDTVGGLVYHALGKVPSAGDEVRVDGCLVTVLTTNGRRIKKVRVSKVTAPPTLAA